MRAVIDTIEINFSPESIWTINVALALVMFGIALEIKWKDFKLLWKQPKLVMLGVACQFVLLPAITFLFVWLVNPIPSIALGMFMVAACPGGNVSNFFTHLAKGNAALSITLTAIATLLAIVMTPFNLNFWGGAYAPTATILKAVSIAPLEMIELVALLLGLPLVLGILVNQRFPATAKRMASIFKITSLLFFTVLVFLALYKNWEVFLTYVYYVFWIVLAHNGLALLTGYSLARVYGFTNADIRCITIETGIQNSGLGLLLIFTFFDGLGGMAIVAAFWGIWHLVSGIILGGLWSATPLNNNV